MGDQMKIRFFTQKYLPDKGWTITIRSSLDGWNVDREGSYKEGAWVFEVPVQRMEFKFVLDFSDWQTGQNNFINNPERREFDYGEPGVNFNNPNSQGSTLPAPEDGIVSRSFFAPNLDEGTEYDLIVVGSGAGGGILADAASDSQLRTLVLEAGSYLFPTHIANLPRSHKPGTFDKHVWGLYYRFFRKPFMNEGEGSDYQGGSGYNLGGRSIFWGGLIPRMRPYEFVGWPKKVEDALLGGYYDKSEILMKKGKRPSEYQENSKQFFRDLLGDEFLVDDAPMAVQRLGSPDKRQISAGMFSTADLLMESRATDSRFGNRFLTINLNHAVQRIVTDGDRRGVRVVANDRLTGQERSYRAKNIVLSAGTLDSAVIAQRSELKDVSQKAGTGLSDHQMWYAHFALPPGSKLYTVSASAKIVIQHRAATENEHSYNCVIELGADFNQGRYVDPDILKEHNREREDQIQLCEIVFLTPGKLRDTNYVRPGDGPRMKVHMQPCQDSDHLEAEMEELKQ